jgi:hypothetical protein
MSNLLKPSSEVADHNIGHLIAVKGLEGGNIALI